MFDVNSSENIDSIELPEGLENLVTGYLDYAHEVIIDRAVVGIDGLKPSQRRILVTMKDIEKVKGFTKCATVCGSCMKLHPHGDASIYDTLCRLTDVSEINNIPLIKGKGKFRKVYSTDPSAASRYTECDLMPIAQEYFNDSEGVERVPSYDNSRTEPELLGVSFPSVLCNPTSGIAIGLASNIPPFNFHDIVNATVNVIKTGHTNMELIPDFTTGGEIVYDKAEFRKLMTKGKCKLKLRGKWRIDGRTIIIDEIPYYTTVQRIKKVAEGIDGVTHCKDLTGLKGGKTTMRLDVECRDKATVPIVLNNLLKNSDLQMTVTANITVVINDKPMTLGIEALLLEWVDFRKKVLNKKFTLQLESVDSEIARYEVFVALLKNNKLREDFIDKLTKSENEARAVLVKAFPNADDNILNWILDMKIRSLSALDKAEKKLADYKVNKAEIEKNLKDIGTVIVKQLEELDKKYQFAKHTTVTNTDYTFDNVEVEPDYKVRVVIHDNFIAKYVDKGKVIPNSIACMSNDIISVVASNGKLLRLDLKNIPLTDTGSRGTYIPSYCNIPDDFYIVDADIVENKQVGYIYSDGFSSVLNLIEWVDNKRITKVTAQGMPETANLIIAKYDVNCEYLYLCTDKGRFGFFKNNFKTKFRNARTRIVRLNANEVIVDAREVNLNEVLSVMPNCMAYLDSLHYLAEGEIFDAEAFQNLFTD